MLDVVEIAINDAPIADAELSPFYINLEYHPQFSFDIHDIDEERLIGQQTISIKECLKKLRSDFYFVFRVLYHKQARAE